MAWPHKILFTTILACGLCAAAPALAQSFDPGTEPVQYQVSPTSPGPHTRVLIEVRGVGSFLGDSKVTWTQDGVVVLSGVGASSYTFTTGVLGQGSTVVVSIDSLQYGTISHTFNFNPSNIDLLWEADTTAPPFYRGLPLMSPGSGVTVAAFPAVRSLGSLLAAGDLSYQWTLNDEGQPRSSGMGRSTFSFASNQLHQSEDVEVDVSYLGARVGHAEVIIPAEDPLLVLYTKDPLRGVLWDFSLGAQASLPGQETIVHAEPYFFSKDSARRGSLQYSWLLNGEDASGPDSGKGELTLRVTGQGAGTANLLVTLQNTEDLTLLERAEGAVSILFGQSGNALGKLFGI